MFMRSWVYLLLLCGVAFGGEHGKESSWVQNNPFQESKTPAKPSAPKVASPLDSAVRVCVQDGDKTWHGSGVIVADGVLTCWHVVPASSAKITVKAKGADFPATILRCDASTDVALLSVKWGDASPATVKIAEMSGNPVSGDPIKTCGLNDKDVFDLTDHKVLYFAYHELRYSPPPMPGRSGGGVYNKTGELVGLVAGYIDGGDSRIGYASNLNSIHRVVNQGHNAPQDAPRMQRRAKRRGYVFTGENQYGEKWCSNCIKLKDKWRRPNGEYGNDEIEIIVSKDVAPGGFDGDSSYPACRFKDMTGEWRYPSNERKAYRMPSSLEDFSGVIDRAGGSYDE